MPRRLIPPALAVALLIGAVVFAADVAVVTPANPGLVAKPPTHKVEKAPFKVEVTLKGVFESAALAEVSVRPEAWVGRDDKLTVERAVEPGTAVKPGDVLLMFD